MSVCFLSLRAACCLASFKYEFTLYPVAHAGPIQAEEFVSCLKDCGLNNFSQLY